MAGLDFCQDPTGRQKLDQQLVWSSVLGRSISQ